MIYAYFNFPSVIFYLEDQTIKIRMSDPNVSLPAEDAEPTEADIIEFLLDSARLGGPEDVTDIEGILKDRPDLVDCVDEYGISMMHRAAANAHTPVIDLLLRYRTAPNLANAEGNTALHWAAVNDRADVCKLLISSGWDACKRNGFGHTPMQEVADKGFEDVEVCLLLADTELDAFMAKCDAEPQPTDNEKEDSSSDDDDDETPPT